MTLKNDSIDFETDEISLKDIVLKFKFLIHFLFTKWKLVSFFVILGAGIGFCFTFFEKPIYTATLTFAMDDDKGSGGLSGALGLASSLGIDVGSSDAGGAFSGANNLMALMKSRKIVEKTLLSPVEYKGKIISLAEYYIEFNKLKEAWNKNPILKSVQLPVTNDRTNFTLQQDSLLKNIFNNIVSTMLSISQPDKKISFISVSVNSNEQLFSKYFCETLINVTSNYYIEIKSKKSRMNVEILQKQTDSIRAELNTAITGVAVSMDNVYNLNPALNVKKTPTTRRQLDVQANTAMLTSLIINLEMSKMTLRKETPLIQVIDRPILPLDIEKLSKKKSLLMGGFFGGFLTVLYLVFTSLYKKLIA